MPLNDEDLVEMPFVPGRGSSAAQAIGVHLPELQAPPTHGLVGNDDTALEHQSLDLAEAEREPEVQPLDLSRGLDAFIGDFSA